MTMNPIEIVTKAIYDSVEDQGYGHPVFWESKTGALAAVTALEAAGYRIVTAEATATMVKATRLTAGHENIWRLMHAAAPKWGDGK